MGYVMRVDLRDASSVAVDGVYKYELTQKYVTSPNT